MEKKRGYKNVNFSVTYHLIKLQALASSFSFVMSDVKGDVKDLE